jgi:type III secretion protein O
MAKYPLGSLLTVREFREQAASNEVNACKARVREAQELVEKRKQELRDYIQWRVEEEKRLFAEIKNREIAYRGLEDHQQDIQQLRGREAQYHESIHQAEAAVEQAKKNLTAAQERHRIACQEKRKIEEHREIWKEEQKKIAALEEDKEMEEFTGKAKEEVEQYD